jgi:hypothetical protein
MLTNDATLGEKKSLIIQQIKYIIINHQKPMVIY